jgi:hypothetical protein
MRLKRLENKSVEIYTDAGILSSTISVPHTLKVVGNLLKVIDLSGTELLSANYYDLYDYNGNVLGGNKSQVLNTLATKYFNGTVNSEYDDRITALEDQEHLYEYSALIAEGTEGTITLPTNATIELNRFGDGKDAIVKKVDSNNITLNDNAVDSESTVITATLTNTGAYVLSGTPSAYPVALVYYLKIKAKYNGNLSLTRLVNPI